MTREEAINILGEVKELDDSIYQYNTKYLEALEMAIKALEQEPILDKIRAEIAELHLIGYATVDGKREIASRAVLEILDKYKAETEE